MSARTPRRSRGERSTHFERRPESWGSTPVFLYGFDDLTPIELDTVETLSQ